MFKFEALTRTMKTDVMLSELLPHTGTHREGHLLSSSSMQTSAINHEPGITFFQTGTEISRVAPASDPG